MNGDTNMKYEHQLCLKLTEEQYNKCQEVAQALSSFKVDMQVVIRMMIEQYKLPETKKNV